MHRRLGYCPVLPLLAVLPVMFISFTESMFSALPADYEMQLRRQFEVPEHKILKHEDC